MTDKDEFDLELDTNENLDAGFDDVEQPVEDIAPAKKSGGGLLVKLLIFLVLVAGGLFASVKYLGVQLPFEIPGLTVAQTTPPVTQEPPAEDVTAAVTLPGDAMPPQPEMPQNQDMAQPAEIGISLDGGTDTTVAAAGTDPFGLDGSVASGEQQQPPTQDVPTEANTLDPWGGTASSLETPAGNAGQDPFAAVQTPEPAQQNNTDPFGMGESSAASGIQLPQEQGVNEQAAPAADNIAVPVATAVDAGAKSSVASSAAVVVDERVAGLEKRLSALEENLRSLKETTASKSDIDDLKKSLDKLEASFSSLESRPAAKVEKSSEKSPVDPAVKTAVKPSPQKASPKPVARKEWVLRSAKPGMAWVSEKGSNELRTVSVGDTLSGIGKVTAVARDASGRWVVNGTGGKINQ